MKKLISGIVLSVCLVGSAFAGGHDPEGGQGPEGLPFHEMTWMLDLSETQTAQLESLKEDMRADRPKRDDKMSIKGQLDQLNPNDSDYEQALNEMADKVADRARDQFLKMVDMRQKVKGILTAEQFEKFTSIIEKKGREGRGKHKH